jgi:hypothetical protein
MHPRVKAAIAYRCFQSGIRAEKLLDISIRRRKVVSARHALICDLFDPASRDRRGPGPFILGASEIGRQIGMDHSSVINALKKAHAFDGVGYDG